MKLPTSLAILLIVTNTILGQSKERIFYSTFSPQDWEVYLSRDAGKSYENFSNHPSLDYDAVISPNGKWVVFTSERSGIPQLYLKATDGTQPLTLLIKSNSFQDQAAFSPDGSQLAFVASHEGNSEIYLIPFLTDSIQDISAAKNLTNHKGGDFRPAFSPDGTHLAFTSDRGHTIVPHPRFSFARQRIGDVYSMKVDGSDLKRLTNVDAWDGSPIWSADGSKILFYSGRLGNNALFEMNSDGTAQKQLIEFPGPAVSPKIISDKKIAFTTWNGERNFKIMQFDSGNKEINALFSNGPDLMFNIDIHPNGLMVFHGGEYPTNQSASGIFGFNGEVLAKLPDSLSFAAETISMYGVRRAFVAPPKFGNTLLYYDASDVQSFTDMLQPMAYSVFWLPLIVVILFLTGIIVGIRNRKKTAFWKYLVFIILTVVFGIALGVIFVFVLMIRPLSTLNIRLIMGVSAIILIVLGWWQFRRFQGQKVHEKPNHPVSKLYSLLFFGLAFFALLCAVFINQFMISTIQFYQVDYVTGEKKPLFKLEKESNTNPENFRVLDSKVTHNGKSLLFTTGSFRGDAHNQGDIYSFDFDSKNITKISDSPYNDGFADQSEDGKLVFRSGRSGNFDIYLKTDDGIENLTNDAHRDNFPAISKKGDKIVFASDRLRDANEYRTMDIFMMRFIKGNSWSEPEKISVGEGQNAHPHFSPDGNWIVYTTEGYGINDEQSLIQPIIFSPQMYGEIVAYNINTKQRVRLTHNKWEEGTPLWVE